MSIKKRQIIYIKKILSDIHAKVLKGTINKYWQ